MKPIPKYFITYNGHLYMQNDDGCFFQGVVKKVKHEVCSCCNSMIDKHLITIEYFDGKSNYELTLRHHNGTLTLETD